MSNGPGLTESLISQLGTPPDDAAVWLGIGFVVLAVLGWVGLELGLARLLRRLLSAFNPPPNDP